MINFNAKLYDNFTMSERLALGIAALGRNDEAELIRLVQTCPQKVYTCTDAYYTDRMQIVSLFATQLASSIQFIYNKIIACELLIFAFNAFANYEDRILFFLELEPKANDIPELKPIYSAGQNELQESLKFGQLSLERFKEAFYANIADLKAIHQAFLEFCKHVEVNGEHMLAFIDLKGLCDGIQEYLDCDIEANQKLLEKAKEKFLRSWNKQVGEAINH